MGGTETLCFIFSRRSPEMKYLKAVLSDIHEVSDCKPLFNTAGTAYFASQHIHDSGHDSELDLITEVKKPSLYRVILHNDDYTSMEFVVYILKAIFGKSVDEAVKIMYDVHRNGRGVAGLYSREIAETRVQLVHEKARANGYPLRCSMESE